MNAGAAIATKLALAPEPSKRHGADPIVEVGKIIVHRMLTLAQLSAWLNIKEVAIWGMVSRARKGKSTNPIPFYQPGGARGWIRFDYDEIRAWMKGGKAS